jgi:heme oxygenase
LKEADAEFIQAYHNKYKEAIDRVDTDIEDAKNILDDAKKALDAAKKAHAEQGEYIERLLGLLKNSKY